MIEQDVIGHLIDVERQAFELILGAQTEADKRIVAVKERCERTYLTAYENLIKELEASLAESISAIDATTVTVYEDFNSSLSGIDKDTPGFNTYLDSRLFG